MSEQIKNLLGPDVGYTDLLNHETMDLMEEQAEATSDYHPIRPSSSGNCTRELTYQLMEYTGQAKFSKKVDSAESHRLLNLGGFIETHLIKMFDKFLKVFKIRYKQQMVEFYRLTSKTDSALSHIVEGSIDLCFWSPKYKCVIDVKSKKDKFSVAYSSQWDETSAKLAGMQSCVRISETAFWVEDLEKFVEELRDPFFVSNFLQLNGYACTEFLKSRGVDHAAIVQYNKNDSRVREIRFKPSVALFEKVKQKFQTVLDAVGAKDIELAPRDYALGSIKCAFCPYSKQCWGDRDALKEYFGTFPKKKFPKDIDRLKSHEALAPLFEKYEEYAAYESKAEAVESEIVKLLTEEKVQKIRLPNGSVYDVRYYKTDDSIKLKRGKV